MGQKHYLILLRTLVVVSLISTSDGTGYLAAEYPAPARLLNRPMTTTFRQINSGLPPDPYSRAQESMQRDQITMTEPEAGEILQDIRVGLQYVLQTQNEFTFAIHGTGTSGMNAALDNLIEPNDKVLVFINGYWGQLMASMSEGLDAEVIKVEKHTGLKFTLEEIKSAIEAHQPQIVAIVYGESTAGLFQSLEGVGDICEANGALLVVDAISVVGIGPVYVDKNKIDAVFISSHKGLGGVAGLAPISLSTRAVDKLRSRKTPPRSQATDFLSEIKWWNGDPIHSISLSLLYALREALATIAEEGISQTYFRHWVNTRRLGRGLAFQGLEHVVRNPQDRMVGITAVKVPPGKDAAKIAQFIFHKYVHH